MLLLNNNLLNLTISCFNGCFASGLQPTYSILSFKFLRFLKVFEKINKNLNLSWSSRLHLFDHQIVIL